MPALGRPFQLGRLYDCRRDSLIPGKSLPWFLPLIWCCMSLQGTGGGSWAPSNSPLKNWARLWRSKTAKDTLGKGQVHLLNPSWSEKGSFTLSTPSRTHVNPASAKAYPEQNTGHLMTMAFA